MGGEQRLVGGDHVGPGVQRHQDVLPGRLEPSDELDHDVGADDEALGVGGEQMLRDVGGAWRLDIPHRDTDQLEPGAGALRELLAVLQQQRHDLGTDAARPEEGNPEVAVFDHAAPFISADVVAETEPRPASRDSRSASVSPRTITRASPSRTATTAGRPR